MSKFVEANEKIAESVVKGYKKMERRVLLGISGGVISAFIIAMAIYMIIQANKKIKLLKTGEEE